MIHVDKHYKIYEDNNYNRYTYKSACRIDYEDFEKDEIMYIQVKDDKGEHTGHVEYYAKMHDDSWRRIWDNRKLSLIDASIQKSKNGLT